MFTKHNNIKTTRKSDGKVNLCSRCVDYGFEKFETANKEELNDLIY